MMESDDNLKTRITSNLLKDFQTKTVAMETPVYSSTVNKFLISGYICYLLLSYIQGHIKLRIRVITDISLLLVFAILAAVLNLDLSGTCLILGYITVSFIQLPRQQLAANNKVVLITGCDRGIGQSLAVHLDRLGFTVYAGCLSKHTDSHEQLVKNCSDRLRTILMDVTNQEQVEEVAASISKDLKNTDLKFWGIVNNAGICYIGNVEMMCPDDMQKIMAVNYFGPVNVCKAFLPLLRKGHGRLVNIASNAGLAPVPLMGVYCASKAALAAMTEVWRYELSMWGIKVSTVIPSGYKTGILAYDKHSAAERWWSLASETVKQDYGKDCFHIKFKHENHENMLSANFTEILGSIADALLSTSPKSYYYNGFLARSLPFLYLHLPQFIGDPIMRILTDWFDFKPQALRADNRNSKKA